MTMSTPRATQRDDGSAALFGRAVSATAAWLVAFGLLAMAQGWSMAGAVALVAGLTAGVVVTALVLTHPDDSAHDRRFARWSGLNDQRNGYGPPI